VPKEATICPLPSFSNTLAVGSKSWTNSPVPEAKALYNKINYKNITLNFKYYADKKNVVNLYYK
jgi:hypothetical protein